ncbi:MAG: hypothetical protein M3N43_06255 [Actinomycetota bacterium]|nr:hypothetical protein [Actinomycetota bacterium]
MVSISRFIKIAVICFLGSAVGPTLLSAQQAEGSATGAVVTTPTAVAAPAATAPAPKASPLFERNTAEEPTLAAAEATDRDVARSNSTVTMSTLTIVLIVLLVVLLVD